MKLLRSKQGFSLIELMMVGGLVAGIAVFLGQMLQSAGKNQNRFETKADFILLQSSLQAIFQNEDCLQILKDSAGNQARFRPSGIPAAQLLNEIRLNGTKIIQRGDNIGKGTLERLELIPQGAGTTVSPGVTRYLTKLFMEYRLKDGTKSENNNHRPFYLYVTSNDSDGTIVSCGTNTSSVQVLTHDMPGMDGLTGNAACASVGKACAYVMSQNYITDDAGCPSASHCARVCASSYNQSLPGVPDGQFLDNIHDCSAQVRFTTTYLHSGVVRCGAHFSAVCN